MTDPQCMTLKALKDAARRHNRRSCVKITQRKSALIDDLERKGARIRASAKRSSSKKKRKGTSAGSGSGSGVKGRKSRAPVKKKQRVTRQVEPMPMPVPEADGLTDGQRRERDTRRIGLNRAVTRTRQFRKDRNLARRIRGEE
jgi:hypothetical protein